MGGSGISDCLMLDDATRHVLAVRIRDAERRLLNAQDHYERQAAKFAYEEALAQFEKARDEQRG
jgi:hypothetical protein